ncbi:hypothetical protein HPB50_021507 [Hyalomma asiaticum]|uniref:Uncharacterized protein n=1 Tax=Hyalomma asiaticum TaxID=266040 RepID=A0ACB7SI05_HYAAI|nr:hypothetical protein HPB50_021507 [Hyalomma asiaticum]
MLRLSASRSSSGRLPNARESHMPWIYEIPKPDVSHQCSPKCKLCGGEHPTGDKDCKQRFQTPHIIGRRNWDRACIAAEMGNNEDRNAEKSVKPPPNTAQDYPIKPTTSSLNLQKSPMV